MDYVLWWSVFLVGSTSIIAAFVGGVVALLAGMAGSLDARLIFWRTAGLVLVAQWFVVFFTLILVVTA